MPRKATITNYYTREIYGDMNELMNGIQEIGRGNKEYGVHWNFKEVTKDEFIKEVEEDKKLLCVETMSGKYIRFNKEDLKKYILS